MSNSQVVGKIMEDGLIYNPKLHRRYLVDKVVQQRRCNYVPPLITAAKFFVSKLKLMRGLERRDAFNWDIEYIKYHKSVYDVNTRKELITFYSVDIIKKSLLALADRGWALQNVNNRMYLKKFNNINCYAFIKYRLDLEKSKTYEQLSHRIVYPHTVPKDTEFVYRKIKRLMKSIKEYKGTISDFWVKEKLEEIKEKIPYSKGELRYNVLFDWDISEQVDDLIEYLEKGDYETAILVWNVLDKSLASSWRNIVKDSYTSPSYNKDELEIIEVYMTAGDFYTVYNQRTFVNYYKCGSLAEIGQTRESILELAKNDRNLLRNLITYSKNRY